MRKYKYVCAECGSDDISFDAAVEWDTETQMFLTDNTWGSYCRRCGEENIAIEKFLLNDNILVL
jgi:DNA-directed RNA polymerase subunit RPC12/RpoP